MAKKQVNPIKAALHLIPGDVRQLVANWLFLSADKAEETCERLRLANRKVKDDATEATASHWEAMGRAARLLGYQAETSGATAKKVNTRAENECSK